MEICMGDLAQRRGCIGGWPLAIPVQFIKGWLPFGSQPYTLALGVALP